MSPLGPIPTPPFAHIARVGSPDGVRKIRPNRRSLTGHVPSQKTDKMIAHESALERDAIILLESDPAVATIQAQPLRIFYDRTHYTPDIFVTYRRSQSPSLIEVKYRSDLFAAWSVLHPALRAGARYAKRAGWNFEILTDDLIRTPRLHNIKQLWRYRALAVSERDRCNILHALKCETVASALVLAQSLADNDDQRCFYLASIWHLVAAGAIAADLDGAPLTNSSHLSIA